MPNNVSIAAVSMTVAASGDFRSVKTTPLLTVAEGMEAMKKAPKVTYKPFK